MSLARSREWAVLALLAAHPLHGYALAQALASGPFAFLGLSRASVYGIINRAKSKGWINVKSTERSNYPEKSTLSLTDVGKKALATLADGFESDLLRTPLPVAPLISVLLHASTSPVLPRPRLEGLIRQRKALARELAADIGHAESIAGQYALRLLEAEIEALCALAHSAPQEG